MKTAFFSLFKTVYGIVFFVIIALLMLFENIAYSCKKEFLLSNGVVFFIFVVLFLIGTKLYYYCIKNEKTLLKTHNPIDIDRLVLMATVVLFLGQCYVFYNVFFLSGWDTKALRILIDTVINNGPPPGNRIYFSMYPNNLLLSYIFSFLRIINEKIGIFSGDYSFMCVVVVNCLINSFSCWLSYKTAKLFTAPSLALTAFVFSVFSIGISGWTVICYSDAFALFLPLLCVYLYVKEYKNAQSKAVGFATISFLSVMGYFIKPQCLFVFIAILILEGIRFLSKISLRSLLRIVTLCIVAVIVFSATNMGLDKLNEKYKLDIDDEKTFGIAHFLMMGANEERNGAFYGPDVEFSGSFLTAEERTEANINAFKERILGMKGGIITHLIKKILTTFNDGTFAWGNEGSFFLIVPEAINSKMAPFLKSIYHMGDRFIYFASFQQFSWLIILFCSFFTVFSKKKKIDQSKLSLVWLVILGFVLYEMLFEVRARYVYIFVPLFCTMVPIGIKSIADCLSDKKTKNERKAKE